MTKFTEVVFKNMRGIIALSFVVGSFGFLITLMWKEIPDGNKDIIQVSAGLVLAVLTGIGAYYFGASKDKTDAEKAAREADPSVNSEIAPPNKK